MHTTNVFFHKSKITDTIQGLPDKVSHRFGCNILSIHYFLEVIN